MSSALKYQEQPRRARPGCIIFLLDHSYSMNEPLAGSPRSKRDALATAINRFLSELLLKCEKDEGVRHYFDVAVISYTTDKQGTPIIGSALKGALQGRVLVSTVELADYPLRVEERVKQVDDGVGGMTQVTVKLPIWYDVPAEDEMAGTPLCGALQHVEQIAREWCAAHPESFPPVVVHITDGEANDGDPEPAATSLRSLSTQDGTLLLFNCHLSKLEGMGVLFPVSEADLPADEYAHLLFRMTSPLPDALRRAAEVKQLPCPPGARGMAFNADSVQMLMLIQAGTPVELIRDDAMAGMGAGAQPGEESMPRLV
jgi:hypothetical protein